MSQVYAHFRTTLNRDKKFLIWNFMEELLNKYHEASRKKASTVFAIRDFESTKLPILALDDEFILETLREYERKKAFIQLHNSIVTLTKKGLIHAQKIRHDWD